MGIWGELFTHLVGAVLRGLLTQRGWTNSVSQASHCQTKNKEKQNIHWSQVCCAKVLVFLCVFPTYSNVEIFFVLARFDFEGARYVVTFFYP